MATANFKTTDVSIIYGITIENDFDWDDAMENIDSYLSDKFGDEYNTDRNIGNVGSISRHDGYMFSVGVDIILRSGYYQDANIDLVVSISDDYGYLGDLSLSDLYDEGINDWVFDAMNYTGVYNNEGMCRMQAPKAVNRVRNMAYSLLKEVEESIASVCDYKLTCAGRFSNGEAVYKEVS